jgi:hypothetical protein
VSLAPDGSQTIRYCREDRVIELVRLTRESGDRPPAEPPLERDNAAPTEVNGVPALVGLAVDGRRVVQLDDGDLMAGPEEMYVAAPAEEVSEEQLKGTLASIPALDPRGLSPRSGRHDLRDVLAGGRLRGVLAEAGLRPVPHDTGVPVEEFRITVPGAPRAQLNVYPVEGFPVMGTSSLGGYPRIIPLHGVDLLFSPGSTRVDGSNPRRPDRPGLGQAVFTCGRVTFNFLGLEDDADPVVEAAERIIAQVEC